MFVDIVVFVDDDVVEEWRVGVGGVGGGGGGGGGEERGGRGWVQSAVQCGHWAARRVLQARQARQTMCVGAGVLIGASRPRGGPCWIVGWLWQLLAGRDWLCGSRRLATVTP
jgi:hypothetical protein